MNLTCTCGWGGSSWIEAKAHIVEISGRGIAHEVTQVGPAEVPRARARQGDPSTSHVAAASVGNLTENQRAVMAVFRIAPGGILDEELIKLYQDNYKLLRLPRQSDSGIRSRRSELAVAGKLKELEKARMSTGRLGRTWTINDEGDTA
jgi:hypothetical protein